MDNVCPTCQALRRRIAELEAQLANALRAGKRQAAPLRQGRLMPHEGNERLLQHLWNHLDELFTFLKFPAIEATNWLAEHAIRFGVILRKVWGGNRTWAGARAQAVLMSLWRTCWQPARNALDTLSQLLRGQPVLVAQPPLAGVPFSFHPQHRFPTSLPRYTTPAHRGAKQLQIQFHCPFDNLACDNRLSPVLNNLQELWIRHEHLHRELPGNSKVVKEMHALLGEGCGRLIPCTTDLILLTAHKLLIVGNNVFVDLFHYTLYIPFKKPGDHNGGTWQGAELCCHASIRVLVHFVVD
ncbi:MAG TPA: transposase [Chthonomonadales bacterium]|nr:transposase [Chthonomonadales bacterium]